MSSGLRIPDLDHRHHIGGVAVGIQGHKHIDVAILQHFQQFGSFCRQLYNIRVDIVLFSPFLKKLLLDTVLVNAYALSIKCRKVVRLDFIIIGRNKDMVTLRTHGFSRI